MNELLGLARHEATNGVATHIECLRGRASKGQNELTSLWIVVKLVPFLISRDADARTHDRKLGLKLLFRVPKLNLHPFRLDEGSPHLGNLPGNPFGRASPPERAIGNLVDVAVDLTLNKTSKSSEIHVP